MRRKLSRKMVVAIVGALSVALSDLAGVQLSPDAQSAIVTLLGLWIAGEATIDAADRIGKRGGRADEIGSGG